MEQLAVIGNAQYRAMVGKAEDKAKVNEPSHTVSNNTVRLKTTSQQSLNHWIPQIKQPQTSQHRSRKLFQDQLELQLKSLEQ